MTEKTITQPKKSDPFTELLDAMIRAEVKHDSIKQAEDELRERRKELDAALAKLADPYLVACDAASRVGRTLPTEICSGDIVFEFCDESGRASIREQPRGFQLHQLHSLASIPDEQDQ